VKALAVEFDVALLCRELDVSRSGYYAWLVRQPSARTVANRILLALINEAYEDSRKTYGSPRVTQALNKQKHPCGRHRVARLMRQAGLRGLQRPGFHPKTTDSDHALEIAPNRLRKAKRPSAPNQVWVADITYIPTVQGWLYLAAVMDLYSRKIVGWATADHLKSSLVKEALTRAIAQRGPASGLIHHSDRGIQYACAEYGRLLHCHGIIASMSAQGHCYDNAAMESFFSTLKIELIYRQSWPDRAQATLAIFEYVETFYNRKRLHSSLNYDSPAQFEERALCNN
jgi:transposase InsO family protein